MILLPYYAIPEIKNVMLEPSVLLPLLKMYILDKRNYEGHDFLREFKEEESGVISFVKSIISSKTDENASKLQIPPASEIIDPLQGLKKVLDF